MNAVLMIHHYRLDYVLDLINDIKQYCIVGLLCSETIKKHLESDDRYINKNIEVVTDLNQITKTYDVVIAFDIELTVNNTYFSEQLSLAQKNGRNIVKIPIDNFRNNTFTAHEINIPIIAICKTHERINSYKVINSLKRIFEINGFSTGVMTSCALGALFGYREISFEKIDQECIDCCVQHINQQIKDYIDNNTFQLLIIDCPGYVGDKHMYALNSAIHPSYTIVLTEAYKLPLNYIRHQNAEIFANYLGTVDLIIMSEYMFSFVDNSIEYGARLSEKSLKVLSKGVYPTVFDEKYIYNKIIEKPENPEVLLW